MKKQRCVIVMALAITACADHVTNPDDPPIRLSGTMKLAAESLTVSLHVHNLSDTTQVVEWSPCYGVHPTNFAVFRDVMLTNQVWERTRLPGSRDCPGLTVRDQRRLGPGESFIVRGAGVGINQILGDSIAAGSFYIGLRPMSLTVRPLGGSYDFPVEALVPVGLIELRLN
jgi:hypothetical protein